MPTAALGLGGYVLAPPILHALLGGVCGKAESFDHTDGLRIAVAGDEIVHFRPSGNAPELRCYAEAASPLRAGFLVQECLSRLKAGLDGEAHPDQS